METAVFGDVSLVRHRMSGVTSVSSSTLEQASAHPVIEASSRYVAAFLPCITLAGFAHCLPWAHAPSTQLVSSEPAPSSGLCRSCGFSGRRLEPPEA